MVFHSPEGFSASERLIQFLPLGPLSRKVNNGAPTVYINLLSPVLQRVHLQTHHHIPNNHHNHLPEFEIPETASRTANPRRAAQQHDKEFHYPVLHFVSGPTLIFPT